MHQLQQTLRTAVALAIFWLPSVATACPTCKGALHDNGMATGYAISILFMMSMPILITAFWAVLIWRLRSNMPQSHRQSHALIELRATQMDRDRLV